MAILVSTQVTGSLGVTGQVTAAGITASLFGASESASYSSTSVSASYAFTSAIAAYTPIVVGSLMIMSFASTMSIDFNAAMFHSSSLSSSVYLTSSNLGVGKMASIKMTASGSNCFVYYPVGWVWLGTAPTAITASKTAVISLTCYGVTDSDILGAFASQL